MDAREKAELIASSRSVADKVRALDAAGFPRAEIARLLGKRYQHVRNVLEADRQQSKKASAVRIPSVPRGVGEASRAFGGVHRIVVEADGRLRLPAEAQAALELRPGGVLVCEIGNGEVVVRGVKAAWAQIDRLMAPFRRADGPMASEELIAERRAEVAREQAALARAAAEKARDDDR